MMVAASATDVKNRFGEYIDKAQHEPVLVEKMGRGYAVILSKAEYERLQAMEDRYWSGLAAKGELSGFLGQDETTAYLHSRMREE